MRPVADPYKGSRLKIPELLVGWYGLSGVAVEGGSVLEALL